ncbi:MAG: hypothetical protein KatS3mg110_2181 [Pirellulaceae bacterium]|nr:MAG: hypothetical protein KatS3mg110_2181 [Pirellulaceae bacterium]
MNRWCRWASVAFGCARVLVAAGMLTAAGPTYDDPSKVDEDFSFQGEYEGVLPLEEGEVKFGVQVIALGKGQFELVAYRGGLPGTGWNGEEPQRFKGQRENDAVVVNGELGKGVIKDGVLKAMTLEGRVVAELKKIERRSPTLGQKPPAGAIVLFDGTDTKHWKNGRMTPDGLLMQGTTSIPTFGNHKLHLEFRLPYQPEDRGQARGNSGVYLQGRYEVQMLDSFGLKGEHNECGGLYSVKAPDVNMCLPPLSWQTYDIEFYAAKYDEDGKLVANPRITVYHNGVKIHDNVELPGERSTTAAPVKPGPERGPVYLQDHGNPVRYRNIWVVELP